MLKLSKQIKFAKKILQIYHIRQRLKRSKTTVQLLGMGAGSKFYGSEVSLGRIVANSSSSLLQSIIWAVFVSRCQGNTFLELGTNIGLNACIIRLISGKKTVTVEGESVLYRIARRLSKLLQLEITHIYSDFEKALRQILTFYRPRIILIDGNHRPEFLEACLNIIFQDLAQGCIIIDDINWSKDMREFWRSLSSPVIIRKTGFFKFGVIKFKRQ